MTSQKKEKKTIPINQVQRDLRRRETIDKILGRLIGVSGNVVVEHTPCFQFIVYEQAGHALVCVRCEAAPEYHVVEESRNGPEQARGLTHVGFDSDAIVRFLIGLEVVASRVLA